MDKLLPWRLALGMLPAPPLLLCTAHFLQWLIRGPVVARAPELGRAMSSETMPSVHPDRLIHPLPKRRLRERLSPDVADSIQYPPAQVPNMPLFYYPYSLKDDTAPTERKTNTGRTNVPPPAEKPMAAGTQASAAAAATPAPVAKPAPTANGIAVATLQTTQLPTRTRGSSVESEAPIPSRATRLASRPARPSVMPPNIPHAMPTLLSTSPSVDGYESFENTKNKKKRKIPTAADVPSGGSFSSADLYWSTSASSANSSEESIAGSPLSATYTGHASFPPSSGISGPGRGRYGRSRHGRVPLHALADAGSNWAGRFGRFRPSWPAQLGKNFLAVFIDGGDKRRGSLIMLTATDKNMRIEADPVPAASSNAGIISSAIANAEKQASRGQENADILGRDSESSTSTPSSSQFTFTYSSQVPGNLPWPGSEAKTPPASAHWQQSRPRAGPGQPAPAKGTSRQDSSAGSSVGGGSSGGTAGAGMKPQGKKKTGRNKLLEELQRQAYERQRAQRQHNAAYPPDGEIYICPYCEYESITGSKPRFLVQDFEMKERKKRLETERRQREQRAKEKARNRGRKGRKAANKNTAFNNRQDGAADGQQYDDVADETGQGGGLGDDIYEDEDDGAGEADDFVGELRAGIGDAHNMRAKGRDGDVPPGIPSGS